MNIKEKLKALDELVGTFRRSGTTTFIQKVNSGNDAYVILDSEKQKKEQYEKKGYNSVVNIDNPSGKFRGAKRKPLLFETPLIQNICNQSLSEIVYLEDKVGDLERKIDKLLNQYYIVNFHFKLNWFQNILYKLNLLPFDNKHIQLSFNRDGVFYTNTELFTLKEDSVEIKNRQ